MTRRQWVFFQPCGCPFGVLEAKRMWRSGDSDSYLSQDEAWREFYDTNAELVAASARGVTSAVMDHDVYVRDVMPSMLSRAACPHKVAA